MTQIKFHLNFDVFRCKPVRINKPLSNKAHHIHCHSSTAININLYNAIEQMKKESLLSHHTVEDAIKERYKLEY